MCGGIKVETWRGWLEVGFFHATAAAVTALAGFAELLNSGPSSFARENFMTRWLKQQSLQWAYRAN